MNITQKNIKEECVNLSGYVGFNTDIIFLCRAEAYNKILTWTI